MYKRKTAVYQRLRAYQGKRVAHPFAKIAVDTEVRIEPTLRDHQGGQSFKAEEKSHERSQATTEGIEKSIEALNLQEKNSGDPEDPTYDEIEESEPHELEEIRGMLIEFIDGFTLAKLEDNAPRESWH